MALGRIPRFSPSFGPGEIRAVVPALIGPQDDAGAARRFEAAFSSYIGVKHAIMVPSARFGFWLLLDAWGFGAGDEILIPALTYFAIPGMAVTRGCTPVFVDTERTTYAIDPAKSTPNKRNTLRQPTNGNSHCTGSVDATIPSAPVISIQELARICAPVEYHRR
jgi:dTDP-4-amino-4,6-dideoxygalactose transaminase